MINELKEAINKSENLLDFIFTKWKVSENLLLAVREMTHNDWSVPEEIEAIDFTVYAVIHGQHYEAVITKKNIIDDKASFSMIQSIESGDLLESLESAIEGDYWEHVKVLCLKFEELEKLDNL